MAAVPPPPANAAAQPAPAQNVAPPAGAAAAAGAAPPMMGPPAPPVPPDPVRHILLVCGMSPLAIDKINLEGYVTIEDLLLCRYSDIRDISDRLNKLPATRGGAKIGQLHARKMEAAIWWLKDKERRNETIDAFEFNAAICNGCMNKREIEKRIQSQDSEVKPPGKLTNTDKWLEWSERLENYLHSLYGVTNIPLNYVIRKDLPAGRTLVTPEEQLIYAASLTGTSYQSDCQRVYGIIKDSVVGLDTFNWIRPHDSSQNGRAAMIALRTHFDGPGEKEKRIAIAEKTIEDIHYKNESALKFETFISRLNAAFTVLEENGQEITERKKLKYLCDKIKVSSVPLQSAVQSVRMKTAGSTTFQEEANLLSEQIAVLFPANAQSTRFGRYSRNVSSLQGRGRNAGRFRSGGRSPYYSGRGRGGRSFRGRGRGGRFSTSGRSIPDFSRNRYNHGVDITDPTRSFSTEEWNALSPDCRNYIMDCRNKPNGGGTRNASGASTQDSTMQQAVERGVMAAHRTIAATNQQNIDSAIEDASQITTDNQTAGANTQTDRSAQQSRFGRGHYLERGGRSGRG